MNAIIGLLATGGSTNHTLHLPAMAAAAGIKLLWEDFEDLSKIIPLLAKVYPNGSADINQFHAAGGMSFIIGELLDEGLLDGSAKTIWGESLFDYISEATLKDAKLIWNKEKSKSYDDVAFHRVIKDKLVQAGDLEFGKKGNIDYGKIGTGKSGLGTIKSEVDKDFNYTKGSVGLARSLKYDTEDSQFFIILQDEPLYEGEYTPIGKVIFGLEALEKIKHLNKSEYVLRPDFINTLRLFN